MTRRSTDRRPALLAVLSLSLAVLSLNVPALTQTTPDRATEPALTNQDVVKLSAAGLGDEVVIAKINQAARVEFQLDTDALVSLREQGLGKGVITAMLNRAGTGGRPMVPGQPQPLPTSPPAGVTASVVGSNIRLLVGDHETLLRATRGDINVVGFSFVTFMHYEIPGIQSRVRIDDPHVRVAITTDFPPEGYFFLVKLDIDTKHNNRSLKIGSAKQALSLRSRGQGIPDKDYVVPCRAEQASGDEWILVPQKALETGEYGIWVEAYGQGASGLYDFGVD